MVFQPNRDLTPPMAVLFNWLLPGLGAIMLGQNKKGVTVLLLGLVGTCFCCVPGVLVIILSHIDVFLCASAIQSGEPLGENEYKQDLLFKIVSLFDKSAVYRG